jgi:hypothetical protein
MKDEPRHFHFAHSPCRFHFRLLCAFFEGFRQFIRDSPGEVAAKRQP